MFELKSLSKEGIDSALQKAERYRLLNEPWDAESICLDILELDPDNQPALITLLLAITDQFKTEGGARTHDAKKVLKRLKSEYHQAYYTGIIWERWGTAALSWQSPGHGRMTYERLRKAMGFYEEAEKIRPAGDDSAIVRWNSCARMIMRLDYVEPPPEDDFRPLLE